MLKNYVQCLAEYGSAYQIKKAVNDGKLYQLERGIYCDEPKASVLELITFKYPNAIITMDTAFYYHGLTDVIPDLYFIATPKNAWVHNDKRIKQIFVPNDLLQTGVMLMNRQNIQFQIYNKERMLIELLRNKNKLPYDYYKEIIGNYRNHLHEMDIQKIQDYAEKFPKNNMIEETLAAEVF